MKRFRTILSVLFVVAAFAAVTAGAQTLGTSVTVVPTVSLAFTNPNNSNASVTTLGFGSLSATTTTGYTYPGTAIAQATSDWTVYADVDVTATGYNAAKYDVNIGAGALTTPDSTNPPTLVYAASSSSLSGAPTTAVPTTGTAYIVGDGTSGNAQAIATNLTHFRVGFKVPNVMTAGVVSQSVNFTATAY